MARVITITSPKGGVGKTTTAANVAAGLSQRGQRVLLVEADPQGALVPSLGCADQPRPAGLVQVLAGEVEARDAVIPTSVDDVDLLAATASDGMGAMELEIAATAHPLQLREILDRLAPAYDHVLVDSAPGVGPLARLALCAADGFVVPVQAEELSLRTLEQLFSLVEEIRRDWQPDLECDGLLLTMVDLRTRMSVRVVNALHERYGDKVLMAMVPRAVGLQDMPRKGAPSLVFAPSSRGAQAYSEVAEELLINLAGRVAAEDMDEEQANQLLAEAVAGSGGATGMWPGPGASMH